MSEHNDVNWFVTQGSLSHPYLLHFNMDADAEVVLPADEEADPRFDHLDAFVLGDTPENSRNEDYVEFFKLILQHEPDVRVAYIAQTYRRPFSQKQLCCTTAGMVMGIPTYLSPKSILAPAYNMMSQKATEIFLTGEIGTDRVTQARVFAKFDEDDAEFRKFKLCCVMVRDTSDFLSEMGINVHELDQFARHMMIEMDPREAYRTRLHMVMQKFFKDYPDEADKEKAIAAAARAREEQNFEGSPRALLEHLQKLVAAAAAQH